ncbi:MAG: hypothetical protein J5582_06670 [Ruminococcus sp.]|uniref:hypothetical protein n=1 Tax=Ruminococcus sp. TaxID=41978 RepID=UPI0025D24215|nr:hypothetical protein [Ruminococcus sp.]MBO4866243.1 hypothetical protein [Ruminococcus sp.]
MTLFEAAAQLGGLPAGVILGMVWGILSVPRLRCPRWFCFVGDIFAVLMFSFCLFMLGVGIEGHLRYPTVLGTAVGFSAVRGIWHILQKELVHFDKKG